MSKAPERPSTGSARSIASASATAAAAMVRLISTTRSISHLVLEVQVQVGQQVAKQRVGGQTVGQRLGHPRRRHRARLAQLLAHSVRPSHPTFGGEVQQHLFVGGEIAAHRGVMDSGAAGDGGQRHRRDTGLDGQ